MKFPETAKEFKKIAKEGKEMETIETESKEKIPDGGGWEYWSEKITTKEKVAVWRRIKSK